jgi:hypothetical protein
MSNENFVGEFEALLEAYKLSNPEKYAIKLANGEFDKFKQPSKVVEVEVKKKSKS